MKERSFYCQVLIGLPWLAALVSAGPGTPGDARADTPTDPRSPEHFSVAAPGQTFDCEVWGTAQGLPDGTVNCLLHASDGFLWIGTDDGLARFDGVEVRRVPLPRRVDGEALRITALAEDGGGCPWGRAASCG